MALCIKTGALISFDEEPEAVFAADVYSGPNGCYIARWNNFGPTGHPLSKLHISTYNDGVFHRKDLGVTVFCDADVSDEQMDNIKQSSGWKGR